VMMKQPIDYQFPSKELPFNSNSDNTGDTEDGKIEGMDMGMGMNLSDLDSDLPPQSASASGFPPRRPSPREFASARNDAVARYRTTTMGKAKLSASSAVFGGTMGAFIGQSIMGQGKGKSVAILVGVLFWIMSMLRNAYGEMSCSLGLALIYLVRRTKMVRKKYKTGAHIRSMCRMGARKPFPPISEQDLTNGNENPWKYEPQSDSDPDFDMIKSLICMALVGSFCGGNFPFIPTWIGSSVGAAAFGVFGIAKNPRGDLIRTMGMRIVAMANEALGINSELKCARKVARVGGKIFDKMMILDRKHSIKDKVVRSATFVYDKASSTAGRVQDDVKEKKDENTSFTPRDRDRRGDDRRGEREYHERRMQEER